PDRPPPRSGQRGRVRGVRHRSGRRAAAAVLVLTSNRADAEDILQVALAKTCLAWDRIQDRAALDSYVRRAMVNTQISWWRRRRVAEYPTDELPDCPVTDQVLPAEIEDTVRRALERLPQRMRAAVVLRCSV